MTTPTDQDEQHDEQWKRPFVDLLTQTNSGVHAVEATDMLNDLVQGVRATGRKGSMSLVIEMEPTKDNKDLMLIRIRAVPKIPKPAPKPDMFYATDGGNLQRDNPLQPVLTGLKVVEVATPEVKVAPPTRTELKEVSSQ